MTCDAALLCCVLLIEADFTSSNRKMAIILVYLSDSFCFASLHLILTLFWFVYCLLHTAVGKSKKLAKRNAALAMLNAIRLGGVEPNIQVVEPDEYDDEDPIALV